MAGITSKNLLSLQEFNPISEWYYFAILGLANLKVNSKNPVWISRRLGLPLGLVQRAYKDLVKNGHICETGEQFRQIKQDYRTGDDDVAAFRIQRYHKQNLQLAADKLDQVPPELREYCTMSIPLNPKKIKAAKAMLRKFREEFSEEISQGHKSELYNLCIQFFPVTQLNSES